MKLPSSVGQKKIKALEQMLLELGVGEWGLGPQELPTRGCPSRLGGGGGGHFRSLAFPHTLALPAPSTRRLQS